MTGATPGSSSDEDLIEVVGLLVESPRPGPEATRPPYRVVVSRPVGHGDDPAQVLVRAGWAVKTVLDVAGRRGSREGITIRYVVARPLPGRASQPVEAMPVHHDADLVLDPDEVPHAFQRLAAYAVVRSERGLLLAQYSDRTNAQGRWGLPGGGVDLDELVEQTVVREVWEETGQIVEPGAIAMVTTSRWIGRAPSGRLEDFHALRVVFSAWCADPVEPVVHDAGGTTSAAQWVPLDGLAEVDVTQAARVVLGGLGLTGGG